MTITRDVAYGSDPLQKLDLYTPQAKGANRPVLLFVHGGGFTRGESTGLSIPTISPPGRQAWHGRRQHRLPPGAEGPVAGGGAGCRLGRRLGPREHREVWRRSRSHHPAGSFGRRERCRGLRRSPRPAGSGGGIGERRDHAFAVLRGRSRACPEACLLRIGPGASVRRDRDRRAGRSNIPLFFADSEFIPRPSRLSSRLLAGRSAKSPCAARLTSICSTATTSLKGCRSAPATSR